MAFRRRKRFGAFEKRAPGLKIQGWNKVCSVETRYKRDWENVFVITLVLYIGVPFHAFYYYWAEVDRSLSRGVPMYQSCRLCAPVN